MTTANTILDRAKELIHGERQQDYGHPRDNLETTAQLWGSYINRRVLAFEAANPEEAYNLTPKDVAMMLALLKVARLAHNPDHKDSLADAAGYLGLVERCDEQ